MDLELIAERLKRFNPQDPQEELQALKEIFQEITLYSLANSGFFKLAAFQGGTALRILHKLQRFSEDLDFSLLNQDTPFRRTDYFTTLQKDYALFGLQVATIDRTHMSKPVAKAFLRDSSFAQVLQLRYARKKSESTVVKIRLEIDLNPPQHGAYENKFIGFPVDFPYALMISVLCLLAN